MKDKSDISLSFRFLKECSLSENILILYFLKKENNINRTFNLPNFVGGFIPTSKQQNVQISSTGQPLTYIGTNNVTTTFRNRVDGDSSFWGVVIGTNANSGAYKYLSGLTAASSISGTPNITFCIRY